MMSGIELNELMTKVSNGSNAISNFEPVQKPYNRELWRIDNGILEEDLVNFVLDKSKKKIDQLGESLNGCPSAGLWSGYCPIQDRRFCVLDYPSYFYSIYESFIAVVNIV